MYSCHILLLQHSTTPLSLSLRKYYTNTFSFPSPQLLLSHLLKQTHQPPPPPTLLLLDLDNNPTHSLSLLSTELNKRNLDIPIIVVKNDPSPSFLLDCICQGADDVLITPVQTQVIRTLSLKTLRRRHICSTHPKSLQLRHVTPAEREAKRTKRSPLTSRISNIQTQTSSITSLFLPDVATIPSIPHPQALQPNYAPSVEEIGCEKRKLASLLNRWDFDPRKIGDESDVVKCVAVMLEEAAIACGGFDAIGVDKDTLHRFIVSVRSSYYADNPYHNFYHGVDVMQATFVFLVKLGLIKLDAGESKKASTGSPILHPHETFALLIAALAHDLGHPGVNNAFMVSSKSGLAELYNDVAVLENFHAAGLFALMRREEVEFFGHQKRDHGETSTEYRDFRRIVTCSILATDMARHAEYIDKIKSRGSRYRRSTATCPSQDANSTVPEADRTLVAGILIKCADISNPARPFPIAMDWSVALLEEFDMQAGMSQPKSGGADEGMAAVVPAVNEPREEKAAVSDVQVSEAPPTFSRDSLSEISEKHLAQQPEGQIAFIEHFVRPLYDAVVGEGQSAECGLPVDLDNVDRGLSVLDFCIPTLVANRNEWERLMDERHARNPRSWNSKKSTNVRAKIEHSSECGMDCPSLASLKISTSNSFEAYRIPTRRGHVPQKRHDPKERRFSLPAAMKPDLLPSQSLGLAFGLAFTPHPLAQGVKCRRRSLPGSFTPSSSVNPVASPVTFESQCDRFAPSIQSASEYSKAKKDISHSLFLNTLPTVLYDIREERAMGTNSPVVFKRARFFSRDDGAYKHRYPSQKGRQHLFANTCHQQLQQRRRKSIPPDWRLCTECTAV